MTFQFHKNNSFISRLIRLLSHGEFNHVSILAGEFVYEAHIDKGVVKTHQDKWNSSTVVDRIEYYSYNQPEVVEWLEKQVGKKYDITGIFSFISIFAKPRMGYWYCSELAMVAFSKMKGIQDEDIENQKVSPYLFYKILELNK